MSRVAEFFRACEIRFTVAAAAWVPSLGILLPRKPTEYRLIDYFDQRRSLVNKTRIQLNKICTRIKLIQRISGSHYSTDANDGKSRTETRAKITDDFGSS